MKLPLPRRLIALFLAALVADGVGLHVALLPALAAAAVEPAETHEHSHSPLIDHHGGCVGKAACPLCAFCGCDVAVIGGSAARALFDRAAPPLGPAPRESRVAASDGRCGIRIRAPPFLPS